MLNTLLPYADYAKSAACLHKARLRLQRIQVLQILNVLHEVPDETGESPWGVNELPAVKMWRGYEPQLIGYGLAMCTEWIERGQRDAIQPKIEEHYQWVMDADKFSMEQPLWMGNEPFHFSHQSLLVKELPTHYRKFFPAVPNNIDLYWPVP